MERQEQEKTQESDFPEYEFVFGVEEVDNEYEEAPLDFESLVISIADDMLYTDAARAVEYLDAMEDAVKRARAQKVIIEAKVPQVHIVDAVEITANKIVIAQPIEEEDILEMGYIDSIGYSYVIKASRGSEQGYFWWHEGKSNRVDSTDVQWYFETRRGRVASARIVAELPQSRELQLRNFVDLGWDTPVHVRTAKHWYKVNISEAEKDIKDIMNRLKMRNRENGYSTIITSNPNSQVVELRPQPKVTYVTTNRMKQREFESIIKRLGLQRFIMKRFDFIEAQGTLRDIAQYKALDAWTKFKSPVLVEDTALNIDALGGNPGPYVKDFFCKMPIQEMSELLQGLKTQAASMEVAYCYYDGKEYYDLSEKLQGKIVPYKGTNRNEYSFDYIFQPEGAEKVLGDMSMQERLEFSPRLKILAVLIENVRFRAHWSKPRKRIC